MPQEASSPVPRGMHTVTTRLWFDGNCSEALAFYERLFGARIVTPPVAAPEGEGILHAMLRLGDVDLMMADARPDRWEQGPRMGVTASLWLYTEDCDALYRRAVDAGCEAIEPVLEAFWGDRAGKVRDPFGHCWVIASRAWTLTPEELQGRREAWWRGRKPGL